MPTPVVPSKQTFDLRIVDVHGAPLANAECDVDSEKESLFTGLRTDAGGMLHLVVPAAKLLFLTIHFPGGELITMQLVRRRFGGADTVEGARARLCNLGYLPLADGDPLDAPADEPFARALDRFRYANRIVDRDDVPTGPASGTLDERTRRRLEAAHDDASGKLVEPV